MKKINFIVLLLACVLLMPSCNRFDEDDFDRIELPIAIYPGAIYMRMLGGYEPANVLINSQDELLEYLNLDEAIEHGVVLPKIDFGKYSIVYACGYLEDVYGLNCSIIKNKPENLYELNIILYTDTRSEDSQWKIAAVVPKIPSGSNIEMEVELK